MGIASYGEGLGWSRFGVYERVGRLECLANRQAIYRVICLPSGIFGHGISLSARTWFMSRLRVFAAAETAKTFGVSQRKPKLLASSATLKPGVDKVQGACACEQLKQKTTGVDFD
jgi:hypothetical protein